MQICRFNQMSWRDITERNSDRKNAVFDSGAKSFGRSLNGFCQLVLIFSNQVWKFRRQVENIGVTSKKCFYKWKYGKKISLVNVFFFCGEILDTSPNPARIKCHPWYSENHVRHHFVSRHNKLSAGKCKRIQSWISGCGFLIFNWIISSSSAIMEKKSNNGPVYYGIRS